MLLFGYVFIISDKFKFSLTNNLLQPITSEGNKGYRSGNTGDKAKKK